MKNNLNIKILIADDHSLVRTGIKALLKDVPDMEIIGEAENGVDAILKVKELLPDVVIIDVAMPFLSGIDAAGIIKKNNPEIGIIVLTINEDEEYVFSSLRNGASGVIYKSTTSEELEQAVRAVFSGNKYIGSYLSELVLEGIKSSYRNDISQDSPVGEILTKREREILVYVAEGLSNSEIASKLEINPRTVDSHKAHIIKKLNLPNNASLRKFAIQNKFVKI